jgi:amidase
VPLCDTGGHQVGGGSGQLLFFGQAFSEGQVLAYGYDFEQATKARVLPKHTPALPSDVLGMAAAQKTP